MRGSIYRFGISVKEFGERAGHKKRFYAGAIICIGDAIIKIAKKIKPF